MKVANKFVYSFFIILVVVLGGAYGLERCQHANTRKELNNKLAKIQKTQKETESAYSRLAIDNKNLQSKNKELQSIITDRDEEIVALVDTNLRLKDKILKIENAKQTIISTETNKPITEEENNSNIDSTKVRYRVDFEKQEDPIKVIGYTLTNPPYAEVQLKWVRDLKLEVILAKNPDNTYRVYIDSEDAKLLPSNLLLEVDTSVLDYKWYQKIGFGSGIDFGKDGIQINISAFYDVLPNLYVGPNIVMGYQGNNAVVFFGAVIGYYPWK